MVGVCQKLSRWKLHRFSLIIWVAKWSMKVVQRVKDKLVRLGSQDPDLAAIMNTIAHDVNLTKNSSTVRLTDDVLLTRIYTGQLMYVDGRDVSVVPHLLMSGTWELNIAQMFRSYLKPSSVVFDVGSNTGYFGVIAGTTIQPPGAIHFFDASPIWEPLLTKTLMVNGLDRFSSINTMAVSDTSGESLTLHQHKDLWGNASLNESPLLTDSSVTVPTISLDDYCKNSGISKVDVIKMDIEGHEEKAFKGMRETIRKNPALVVFMEYFEPNAGYYSQHFFSDLKSCFSDISVIKGNETYSVASESDLNQTDWSMLILKNK